MGISAKRDDAFHWSGSEPRMFSFTKLVATLAVAAGTLYVYQLWAPGEPTVEKPTVATETTLVPPRKIEEQSIKNSDRQKSLPGMQSRPASMPASQAEVDYRPSARVGSSNRHVS